MAKKAKKESRAIDRKVERKGLRVKVSPRKQATSSEEVGPHPSLLPGDSRAQTPAGMERHEFVHQQALELVRNITRDFIWFLILCEEIVEQKHYERYGYSDPKDYFDQVIGYNWRTVQKYMAITAAIRRIEDMDDRALAAEGLASIGMAKAAIISPMIGEKGQNWRGLLRSAKKLTEGDLQDQVSRAMGSKRKRAKDQSSSGPDESVGERRYLNGVLNKLPQDVRDQARDLFEAGRYVINSDAPATVRYAEVFVRMIEETYVEWAKQARECGWRPKGEVEAEGSSAEMQA